MHGFSFRVFEDEVEVQDVISPRSLDQILISNAPRMRKCIKKRFKPMDAWIVVSKQFNFTQKSKGVFVHEEQFYLKRKRGITVRSTVDSRSMVTMERLLVNRCFYLMIVDEGSRCIFIAWRRKCVDSLWALDLHRAVLIDLKVHPSWRISL